MSAGPEAATRQGGSGTISSVRAHAKRSRGMLGV
jgi:hypothetical protein